MRKELETLIAAYPRLKGNAEQIQAAFELLENCFRNGGKLLLCGNGGSACDCEHIAGELMKSFKLPRKLSDAEKAALKAAGDEDGRMGESLQSALPCIVLTGLPGLTSAFNNDVDPAFTYAQQVWGYAQPGDVLLGITTSGSSKNVVHAAVAAKAKGAKVLGPTGEKLGKLAPLCDVLINVPEQETYCVQELHLPIYHALCLMLENRFFDPEENA